MGSGDVTLSKHTSLSEVHFIKDIDFAHTYTLRVLSGVKLMLEVENLDNLNVCISFELGIFRAFRDTCTVFDSIQNSHFVVYVFSTWFVFFFSFSCFVLLEDKQIFEFRGIWWVTNSLTNQVLFSSNNFKFSSFYIDLMCFYFVFVFLMNKWESRNISDKYRYFNYLRWKLSPIWVQRNKNQAKQS